MNSPLQVFVYSTLGGKRKFWEKNYGCVIRGARHAYAEYVNDDG